MTKRFETDRLIVRPFEMGDLDEVYRLLYSDPEVCRYFCGETRSLDKTREWLAHRVGEAVYSEFGRWAVVRKADGQFLGQVGLDASANKWYRFPEDPHPLYNALEVELNFCFGRAFWGQSYAFEACQPLIRYAFEELRLPRLVSGARFENERSMRLQRRLGFTVIHNLHPDYPEWASVLPNPMLPAAPPAESGTPHVPALDGDPWHIGTAPDLGELQGGARQEVVDHAIFQSADSRWHLWACVRGTRIGRLLYEWEGASLEHGPWTPKGVAMRADPRFGESINDWMAEEWIQAPHVIQVDGTYYMFYGGHNTEFAECQICLATSRDGRTFERYRNTQGYSRLFIGPGQARDPMVCKIGDVYHCYYCGADRGNPEPCKVYCRTSPDLFTWSEAQEVAWGGHSSGTGAWSAECPFVVYHDGYYYLFRTSEYRAPARTHVYRSRDPLDFGRGTDEKWVATLRVAAPEVIQVGDQWYISSVEDLRGGVQLARLKWI